MKKLVVAIMLLGAAIIAIPGAAQAVPMAGWSGSTVISPGSWTGTVYYDVYAPFQADAPGIGSVAYYAYFYRIENNTALGGASLKHFTVSNLYKAPIIAVGTTDYLAGRDPLAYGDAGDSIVYDFWVNAGSHNEIFAGEHSDWCYYTSPLAPSWGRGSLQDGGEALFGKMPNPAPEPASMTLLGLGLIGFAGRAIRRKFTA